MALVLGLSVVSPTAVGGQPASDDEPYLPGLAARYRDDKGNTAVRIDPQLAFHWTAAPDGRLGTGPFQATWQGHLLLQVPGDYRFFVFGSGEVGVRVAGREVVTRQALRKGWAESAAVTLEADFLPLELAFRRTEADARLMVFWSGPGFGLEPVPPRFLYHSREKAVPAEFERGQLLSRVLRCGHCHGDERPRPAPALDRLAGNLARDWLVRWLVASAHNKSGPGDAVSPRRMPALGLTDAQAEAIADWLLASATSPSHPTSRPTNTAEPSKNEKPAKAPKKGATGSAPKPKPDAKAGEQLFVTVGCLACHTWRDLGASGWPGGGDLTHSADKRPPGFFAAWLADPTALNRDHHMPVFALSEDERTALGLFLAEQKSDKARPDFGVRATEARRAEGAKLAQQFRCASCHQLPGPAPEPRMAAPALTRRSRWDHACLAEPNAAKGRPGYRLAEDDARAVRLYYSGRQAGSRIELGALALVEHNCLACHAREGTRAAMPLLPPLLADKLAAVAQKYPELAIQLPALTPPALTSVGDKLHDQTLADMIGRRGEPHRPYLRVRMPHFPLHDDELSALVRHLAAVDRMPERASSAAPLADPSLRDRFTVAGGRLVGSDGFGCTSCHQVGSVQPSQAQLNARGSDLSGLDRRIRKEWFDRWVRNPARIVPRMEMPSVQLPVSGVLGDQLDDQLAAVWQVLNVPGFEPPPPNPIRVLRQHGHDAKAEPVLLTDVLGREAGGDGKKTFSPSLIKPFLIGLANRHNVLLDLETARLARWTVGDAARQRTQGKTWYWEPAGTLVLDSEIPGPDVTLTRNGRDMTPQLSGQFVTEADGWQADGAGLVLRYRLKFADSEKEVCLQVVRKLSPLPAQGSDAGSGFAQELTLSAIPAGTAVRLRVLGGKAAGQATRSADGKTIHLNDRFAGRITLHEPEGAVFVKDATSILLTPDAKGNARVILHYLSAVPVDRLPEPPPVAAEPRKPEPVEVAPGFTGAKLPLPPDIMPTGLSWRPDGRLVFSSLKGQVFETVGNREDRVKLLADGLPAPYGVHAGPDWVDVSAKYAVLRVWDDRRIETVASGWGYTHDYHDWAVGLPRNERGEYFLGIPCQQDQRSPAAARYHGDVLRLVPRVATRDDPRRFTLQPSSTGHRFPMGFALDRAGELFVTDNQGNYNPFNELNHVRPGVHFGFVNALDKGKPAPLAEPPAVAIPHPWTRSVNGICFLNTPKELGADASGRLRDPARQGVFGPLEGHLVGCEYDTRRLVRMTLQRVGDTFQGAAYPLSIPPDDPARGFLGPVVCAVSPRGELYVGSIRDSGWGAGNNVGEIVRVRVEPDKLPGGLAEVRATKDGFTLDFFQPVDRQRAARPDSYAIQSYRREVTPAYGGPDVDRRTEKLTEVTVADDARRVTLRLAEPRPGFVYEFRLKNLTPGGKVFHPAEAHYTLRVVPR